MEKPQKEELTALRAEVERLQGQVSMWETVFDMSHQELREAHQTIQAQERVLDMSNSELKVLRTDIERLVNVESPLQTEILAILSSEAQSEGERWARLERLRETAGAEFCVDALRVLMNVTCSPEEAAGLWDRSQAHARKISDAIGRPFSVVAAMLDFMANEGGLIQSPKVMEIGGFAEMIRHAVVDPLTGLYNRRFLDRVAERELTRARRFEQPLTLVVCDIDHFKKINDTFGHGDGDKVLTDVAAILKEFSRADDAACRLGGEEFLILVPDLAGEHVFALAEKIRTRIAKHNFPIAQQVTLSVGVASFPEFGPAFRDIFLAADQALYAAKQSGRNRTMVANSGAAG
ncbi:MAG: diguanylate cyclase [Spirochaetales bacterium]|nr:diguanylate cyclase [Leptospiraceae bacterium]MCP5482954.1 diguanylate cyclase [Spirochaetales bacterium]MCP5484865.1 diguanylate cyclase [Spirochaetales bacterium]